MKPLLSIIALAVLVWIAVGTAQACKQTKK